MVSEFGISLIEFPEYKNLTEKAVAVLVQMPTTCLCEGLSSLVMIKSKKNSILEIDSLMRREIKKELTPCYGHIAETIQEQASH